MNRIPKYRAWDKNEKKWVPNHIVGGLLYELQVNKETDVLESYDLFEYTGGKDKYGIEVCEGNIVKRTVKKYDWDKFYKNETSSALCIETQISFVEYRGNGFWVHDEDFGYEGEDMWNWNEMEIIGNISEHSNLLPVKNGK